MDIDFAKHKRQAISAAKYAITQPGLHDSLEPKPYALGQLMLGASLRLYKTAVSTERSTEDLLEGWRNHFFLDTLCSHDDWADWLDFAQNKWLHRQDDFLPDGWLSLNLASCGSFLEAAISFAWTFSRFTKDSFRKVENPSPRKKTKTILSEINAAFDDLAKTVLDVYEKIVTDSFIRQCDELLQRELGLYLRSAKGESGKSDEERINEFEKRYRKLNRIKKAGRKSKKYTIDVVEYIDEHREKGEGWKEITNHLNQDWPSRRYTVGGLKTNYWDRHRDT